MHDEGVACARASLRSIRSAWVAGDLLFAESFDQVQACRLLAFRVQAMDRACTCSIKVENKAIFFVISRKWLLFTPFLEIRKFLEILHPCNMSMATFSWMPADL